MVLILGKTKEGSHKRQQDMYSVKCFFRVTSSCCFNESSSCILKGVSVGGRELLQHNNTVL